LLFTVARAGPNGEILLSSIVSVAMTKTMSCGESSVDRCCQLLLDMWEDGYSVI
jgi:hypothetical protein